MSERSGDAAYAAAEPAEHAPCAPSATFSTPTARPARPLPEAPPVSAWRSPLPWSDDLQATCLAEALGRRGIPFERVLAARRRGVLPRPWLRFSTMRRGYFYRQGILLCGAKGARITDCRHVNGTNPMVTSDKLLTKRVLIALGCPVPAGEVFGAQRIDEALRCFERLTPPVCVKRRHGTQGRGLATAITTAEDFFDAFRAAASSGVAIVEEEAPGQAVRFLYLDPDVIAVRLDTPAHVIGDGSGSIATLLEERNRERARRALPPYPPLQIDASMIRHLARQGLTIHDVPAAGRRVMLRGSSNVPSGGEAVAGDHIVHPSYAAVIAQLCRRLPGLRFAAVDTIVEDPAVAADVGRYWILELNSAPGLLSFHFLWQGPSPDIAGALVDRLIEAAW